MIIKHKSVKTETTTDEKGNQTTKQTETIDDLSRLTVGRITWEGSRLQVARKLTFSYVQDARDPNLPNYVINCGETVYGYDISIHAPVKGATRQRAYKLALPLGFQSTHP